MIDRLPAAGVSPTPLPKKTPPAEVGGEKTVTQHVGNAGFGACSVAAFTDSLGTAMDTVVNFPGAEVVPGLNLGVACVEGYNSIKKLREGDKIVAATAGGNAVGSLGTFMAQLSLAPALIGAGRTGMMLGVGAALGAVGGGLGIAAGIAEIRKGREIMEAGGSSRTMVMGILDITSGVTSLAGAGAMAMGAAPVGICLMMAANVVDLCGIGVDYLWKKLSGNKSKGEAPEAETEKPPADKPTFVEDKKSVAPKPVEVQELATASLRADAAPPPVQVQASPGSTGSRSPATLVEL